MKVYYKIRDSGNDITDVMLASIADAFPAEIKDPLNEFFKNHQNMKEKYIIEKFEKVKYKVMWALRSIEKEINDEGGMIVITWDFKIELKDFSEPLSEQILRLIDSSC